MNIACFRIHLEQTKRLLKRMDLLCNSNIDSGYFGLTEETRKANHGDDYNVLYQSVENNFDYEFKLKDGSFLQFAFLEEGLRYAFLESVSECLNFDDYMLATGVSLSQIDELSEEDFTFYNECYEAEKDSLAMKVCPLYIRYDYTKKLDEHVPNCHSSSHLHFGWHNNSRIPCSKVLTPETFACFAIKMYSPSTWKDLLIKGFITDTDYEFKKLSKDLPHDLWIPSEQRDLYLV